MKLKFDTSTRTLTIMGLILFVVIVGIIAIMPKEFKEVKKKIQITKEVEIYKLRGNATELQKKLFDDLYNTLKAEEIDEEKYAVSIAKLFISEYWTLINRLDREDIGGIIYIPEPLVPRFMEYANELYCFFDYYILEYRKENLSEVTSVTLNSVKSITYNFVDSEGKIESKNNLSAYEINLSWEYNEDRTMNSKMLPSDAILKIVKWDKYYSVLEMNVK
ncbi:MAG TPA: hypothetical protein GX690_01740 [Tenericutes bacterium]|nr:hypothetical protein [Mycoplasmatota bacterium]